MKLFTAYIITERIFKPTKIIRFICLFVPQPFKGIPSFNHLNSPSQKKIGNRHILVKHQSFLHKEIVQIRRLAFCFGPIDSCWLQIVYERFQSKGDVGDNFTQVHEYLCTIYHCINIIQHKIINISKEFKTVRGNYNLFKF